MPDNWNTAMTISDVQTTTSSPDVIPKTLSDKPSGIPAPWPVFWVASIAVFLVSMDSTMLFAAFSARAWLG